MGEYHEAIQRELDKIEEGRARVLSYVPVVAHAEEIIAEFPDMSFDISIDWELGLRGVCLKWRMGKEDRLSKIEPVLKSAIQKGYHPDKFNAVYDHPTSRMRLYAYGLMKIEVFFAWGEGSACTYVKTGTKTEDVFELKCQE